MRKVDKIVFASNNKNKFFEIAAILSEFPEAELVPASKIIRNAKHLGNVEKFDTYVENAAAKARLAQKSCHYPSLADDSGLEVEALDGKPGVRSARFASPRPGMSQSEANMTQLLEDLKGRPMDARSAQFVCVVTLSIEGIIIEGRGELKGKIAEAPQGTNGFGYDPVFIPEGETRTLAEMTDTEKNEISHRGRAVRDLLEKIQSHGIAIAKP